ncbi:MAG: hypothetical protein ACKO4U_17230 [Caldilinea sp.]|jgi:hypothetical protein
MKEPWTDSQLPLVAPDAQFRQELHRALQDTHQRRQQRRQPIRTSLLLWVLLVCVLAGGLYWRRQKL